MLDVHSEMTLHLDTEQNQRYPRCALCMTYRDPQATRHLSGCEPSPFWGNAMVVLKIA